MEPERRAPAQVAKAEAAKGKKKDGDVSEGVWRGKSGGDVSLRQVPRVLQLRRRQDSHQRKAPVLKQSCLSFLPGGPIFMPPQAQALRQKKVSIKKSALCLTGTGASAHGAGSCSALSLSALRS